MGCRIKDVNVKDGMNGSEGAFTLYPFTFWDPHSFLFLEYA